MALATPRRFEGSRYTAAHGEGTGPQARHHETRSTQTHTEAPQQNSNHQMELRDREGNNRSRDARDIDCWPWTSWCVTGRRGVDFSTWDDRREVLQRRGAKASCGHRCAGIKWVSSVVRVMYIYRSSCVSSCGYGGIVVRELNHRAGRQLHHISRRSLVVTCSAYRRGVAY